MGFVFLLFLKVCSSRTGEYRYLISLTDYLTKYPLDKTTDEANSVYKSENGHENEESTDYKYLPRHKS